MKELLDKLLQRHKYLEPTAEEELRRQVNVLYGAFTGLIGSEKMVLRASKYSALSYIHSEDPRQRLVGLQRLIYEDVSYDKVPDDDEVINVLNELEMVLAEMLARQAVEERLEKKISQRMDEKQQEYVREIKMELIKEELHDVETPQTKRKLKELDDLENGSGRNSSGLLSARNGPWKPCRASYRLSIRSTCSSTDRLASARRRLPASSSTKPRSCPLHRLALMRPLSKRTGRRCAGIRGI